MASAVAGLSRTGTISAPSPGPTHSSIEAAAAQTTAPPRPWPRAGTAGSSRSWRSRPRRPRPPRAAAGLWRASDGTRRMVLQPHLRGHRLDSRTHGAGVAGEEQACARLLLGDANERSDEGVDVRVRAEVAQREDHERVVRPAERRAQVRVCALGREAVKVHVPEHVADLLRARASSREARSSAFELTTTRSHGPHGLCCARPAGLLTAVDERVAPPRAHDERTGSRAGSPVAVGEEVVRVDDVHVQAVGEAAECGCDRGSAGERDPRCDPERLDRVEVCGRVVLARLAVAREVHVVTGRRDRPGPAEEMDGPEHDPEHAERAAGHGGQL